MADHKFGGNALVFDKKFDMVLEAQVFGVFQGTCRDPAALGTAIIDALVGYAEDASSAAMMVTRPDMWRMLAEQAIADAVTTHGASGSVVELSASLSDATREKMKEIMRRSLDEK